MDIRILGPVCLAHEGRAHEITRHQARAVLALLSLTPGRPLSADRLLDELWPTPSGNTRNAMQAAVARLRRTIARVTGGRGDDVVRTAGQGYLLDLPTEAVDATRFLWLADRAAGLLASAPATAAELLEQALKLWRGAALTDVGDALAFQIEAVHLEERRLTAWEDLMAARLTLGSGTDLVGELRRLHAAHPERERFVEFLMVALYRCGRQTEALTVYHAARRWLADELGLYPGQGMSRCYEAILAHDSVLG